MTKDEISLVLFFETCCVDQHGAVDPRAMNEEDYNIAKRWDKEGYIRFGRICAADLGRMRGKTNWVELSDQAWADAHAERKARGMRFLVNRTYKKTSEVR
jgi:hypothetical protein